jgi:hypothetical protein
MNWPSIALWGLIATLMMSALLAIAQGVGLTRISVPFILGTMVTEDRYTAMWSGLVLHILNGWAFALLYALAFQSLGRANVWLGAIGGLLHAAFVLLVLMPLLPGLHPRMASERQGPTPTRALQPPGFLALHYGRQTPIVTVLSHIAYGAIIGAFYHVT